MTRKEEIELAWLSRAVQSNYRYDEKSFKEAVEWADKTMIERAKAWVKNCFIGPFGEGLADNIANEFAKYLEE